MGRVVWTKTLSLDLTPDRENRWLPVGLDVQPLLAQSPGGMYRLTLSFRRPHVVWPCEASAAPRSRSARPRAPTRAAGRELLGHLVGERVRRLGPALREPRQPLPPRATTSASTTTTSAPPATCSSPTSASWPRPGEDDTVIVFVTDLRTTDPDRGRRGHAPRLPAADARHRPDRSATASSGCAVERPAFLATVRHGGQTGYLRLDPGSRPPRGPLRRGRARAPRRASRASSTESAASGAPATPCTSPSSCTTPRRGSRADHPVRFDLAGPARPARADRDPHPVDRRLLRVRGGDARPTPPPATTRAG